MEEVEKKEFETYKIVWMLIWRNLVWQIPFTLVLILLINLVSQFSMPAMLTYVLIVLACIVVLIFTTKLAFNGTIKKAIIKKGQVNLVSYGYLLSFVQTILNKLKSPDALDIVGLLIQLVVVYLYIKKLLNKVAV